MSPNIGKYHMKALPNSKETSTKISVLVTIFVTAPLILAKAVRSGPCKLLITFGSSPRKGLYLLKLVFDYKEASAKISVLVTILCIKFLIETKPIKTGQSKFSMILVMSPQIG